MPRAFGPRCGCRKGSGGTRVGLSGAFPEAGNGCGLEPRRSFLRLAATQTPGGAFLRAGARRSWEGLFLRRAVAAGRALP